MVRVIFFITVFIILIISPLCLKAKTEDGPILIISSYNPDTPRVATNISEFIEEYRLLGGKRTVLTESLNYRSLYNVHKWARMMYDILQKYRGENRPSLILIFGQEAWASYLTLDESEIDPTIPVLCGAVSRNIALLPNEGVNIHEWEPESVDVYNELESKNIVAGFVYEYDIKENIKLVKKLYPDVKHIVFLSDNSYGGVALQAHVKQHIRDFLELNLILLDGRKQNMASVMKSVENMSENTVLLMGIWRVDASDNHLMPAYTRDIIKVNPGIPCFTLTSIGIEQGAIGGYIPMYHVMGKQLAVLAFDYVDMPVSVRHNHQLVTVQNRYLFDYKVISELGIVQQKLPEPYDFINKEPSFFEHHITLLIFIVAFIIVLIIAFTLTLSNLMHVKKLKNTLEEAKDYSTLIVNNINAGIQYIMPDYRIKWLNDFSVSNYKKVVTEDVRGTYCYKALYGHDKPCDFCPIPEALKSRGRIAKKVEFPGNVFLLFQASPIYNGSDEVIGVVVRYEDVSKEEAIQQELIAAKEQAEESDRLKSAFLANMSHEIRTPLNAIVGFSNVLINQDTDEDEKAMYAEVIQDNSDLLLRLINDILDISRLETSKTTFQYASHEIISFCNYVLTTAECSAKKNGAIRYILDTKLEKFDLVTDLQRLQQILINLLSNAGKFTTEGLIILGVHIDYERNMLEFSVADTGRGIPPEKQKVIFNRFEKADEFAQGTGLGLAICQITVEKFGGKIWVDPEYTNGARLVFTHPLGIEPTSIFTDF